MKKLFLTLLIVVASLTARAYDYPYLVFQTTDGTAYVVAVESLSIDINSNQLITTNNEGTQTFTLSELSKMYFSVSSPTDINELFSSDGGEVEAIAVTGVSLGRFANASEAIKALKPGIYVLKSKSNVTKIVVR